MTQLSTLWIAQRLRDREPGLRRNPRNPGSWHRPRLLPQAGLGCFGWLPPAYQTVTRWGKCCETALTMAAKNCGEKKKGRVEVWKAQELGEGEGRPWLGGVKASWLLSTPSPSLVRMVL